MKTVAVFGLAVSLLVSGCVAAPYYDAYQQPYHAAPPVQYAPPVVYVPTPYYRPQYYIAPMYGASAYYGEPFLSFKFIFGGGGKKHHGGGRHYRGR